MTDALIVQAQIEHSRAVADVLGAQIARRFWDDFANQDRRSGASVDDLTRWERRRAEIFLAAAEKRVAFWSRLTTAPPPGYRFVVGLGYDGVSLAPEEGPSPTDVSPPPARG